jgi:hypothetical protein
MTEPPARKRREWSRHSLRYRRDEHLSAIAFLLFVLTEPEWALFAAGVELLWDWIESDIESGGDGADLGLVAFDRVTPEQKLVMLADVANALRSVSVPAPRHTASNEATIAAVFSVLRGALECEIDNATDEELTPSTSIRHLLLACCFGEDDFEDPLPDASSDDPEAWDLILEEIVERILWDCDYQSSNDLMNLPPDVARQVRQVVGIDEEYDLTIPPDPDEGALAVPRQKLTQLVRSGR